LFFVVFLLSQVYPDEPHGLNGAKIHVHKSMQKFFEDCFRQQINPKNNAGIGLIKGGKFEEYD
jgi:hypothetical protein